jgi:hypothetical protein
VTGVRDGSHTLWDGLRPMTAIRRVSLVTRRPGEGPLTEPVADTRIGTRELVLLPLSSHSLPATAMGRNVAGLGGRLTRYDGGRRIGKNRDTPI